MYRAYVFDFDFTLADASDGIVACANHALTAMGFAPLPRDNIRATVGQTLTDSFRTLTGSEDGIKAEEYKNIFNATADELMLGLTRLYPDTLEVLRTLKKRGASIAIVTTKFRYRIEQVLERYDFSELIDYIIGYEDVTEHKPAPEGLIKVIAALGVKPNETLYCGDHVIDARTAAAAGTDFAAVTTGTTPAASFMQFNPVLCADSLTEILRL